MKNEGRVGSLKTSESPPLTRFEMAASLVFRTLVFALCGYGLLYYAYKYYQPAFGGSDYFNYYNMYLSPFDNREGDPFRMRKLSALATFLIYKSGLYYPNSIAFEQPLASQKVFFAALLSNSIALGATALVCSYTTRERGAIPMLAGALVFLCFGTQAFVLTGLTEGWSWFLVAIGFFFYSRRLFPCVWIVLIISAWQRETIPIVFGVFAAVDWWRREPKDLRPIRATFFVAIAAFVLYLVLRKINPAPVGPWTDQLDLAKLWSNLRGFSFTKDWLLQVALSQNLLFLWGLLFIMARLRKQQIALYGTSVLAVVAVLVVGGIASGSGNNTGRILQILTPILAPLASIAIARLRL